MTMSSVASFTRVLRDPMGPPAACGRRMAMPGAKVDPGQAPRGAGLAPPVLGTRLDRWRRTDSPIADSAVLWVLPPDLSISVRGHACDACRTAARCAWLRALRPGRWSAVTALQQGFARNVRWKSFGKAAEAVAAGGRRHRPR